MVRPISEWSITQLETMIDRYRERGVSEGGPYRLRDVMVELLSRTPSTIEPRQAAEAIVTLSQTNEGGLVSYGSVWKHVTGRSWSAMARTETIRALDGLIAYCVTHELPLISTLVVADGADELGQGAVEKTARQAADLGIEVGADLSAFVLAQQQMARALSPETLPPARSGSTDRDVEFSRNS